MDVAEDPDISGTGHEGALEDFRKMFHSDFLKKSGAGEQGFEM